VHNKYLKVYGIFSIFKKALGLLQRWAHLHNSSCK